MANQTESDGPAATAVIVAYESRHTIGAALRSLQAAVNAGLATCVVVDNASTDGTADFVAAAFPHAKLIRSDQNLGFGRGCNRGFTDASTRYVLFINPDAEIDLQSLQHLCDFLDEHPRAGIVAPATIVGEEALQDVGILLTPGALLRAALRRRHPYPHRRTLRPGDAPFPTNWVCGAIMLVRSELFRRLGGFDPRFFLYFEETDFCLRAERSGAEIWASGRAVGRHVVGASARLAGKDLSQGKYGDLIEHFFASRYYYLGKNFGWPRALLAESAAAIAELLYCLRAWLRGDRDCWTTLKRPYFKLPVERADQL